ncbi:GrpB family protein [Phytohabitans sp. LJ34]|uniref:GrpB family protein n=1 Tax=Phytohabitans sp. LJ34 TaxID=3452217 RepID=UPI003F88F56D
MDPVVVVVAYDPAWPALFAAEARLLAAALPGTLSIEHVGSTSVPGLAAKPVVDIVVVVAGAAAVDVAALVPLGYTFRPHAFPDDPDHLFLVKDTGGVRSHHLHVFGEGSPWPARNRAFRDYLAAHPDAARRYEAAKHAAAALHPDSRGRYGEAKEEVMLRLVAEADAWSARRRAD